MTGHGISAALLTGVAAGCLESQIQKLLKNSQNGIDYNPAKAISEFPTITNEIIYKTSTERNSRAMSLSVLAIDLNDGTVWQTNAGHVPIYVISNGKIKAKKTYQEPY